MSDEPKKRPRAWIGWTLFAAVLFYPLSMGPALWVATKIMEERDDHQIVRSVFRVYDPLLEVARAAGAVPLLNWYVNWFVDVGFN
jgi:hypothetical protein